MNLEEKLRELKQAAHKTTQDASLERQLEHLRRLERRPKPLPAERAEHGIEHYIDGRVCGNALGQYFLAQQTLPFGRPYGKFRIGEVAISDLEPLKLFLGKVPPASNSVIYLDTETTGLAGGTGTCAFLIGIGAAEGSGFRVQQFFLRDFTEERAVLASLAEALAPYELIVTYNGKTFDLPLLETRYTLARLPSPFARMTHLDLLHPARRLWKLRLERCELKHLERELLGISRNGDVAGSEIPQIYFDYLRTGSARGLQPVFFHNALDIVTLAGLTVEVGQMIAGDGIERDCHSLDLFSLSRVFERFGSRDQALAVCREALARGLPETVEPHALWHLASNHKRQLQFEEAAQLWMEVARRGGRYMLESYEELAMYHEHRRRDFSKALEFTEAALDFLRDRPQHQTRLKEFLHRRERLQRKSARYSSGLLPCNGDVLLT